MIELHEVGVSVEQLGAPSKTLLSDVTTTLAERRIAVIGANGSGKSTFCKLINGLVTPSRGWVLVDGLDTLTDAAKVRSRVGYVFTDPLAQLVMQTPIEDIELSLRARVPNRAERRRQALDLLAERGLERVAHQSIYDLSGGERQLVSLTTVLAVRPSIVIADEPTTLLDLRNRERLRRALWDVDAQVVVSTHDLDLAAQCDRVLLIDSGRLVGDGEPAEQIERYRELMADE